MLIEKGLLEVIFTIDGKEYLTPDQLRREIEDELYVNGGRVNLVELSKILNVDLQKIFPVAEKFAADEPDVSLILGELILFAKFYEIEVTFHINSRSTHLKRLHNKNCVRNQRKIGPNWRNQRVRINNSL